METIIALAIGVSPFFLIVGFLAFVGGYFNSDNR